MCRVRPSWSWNARSNVPLLTAQHRLEVRSRLRLVQLLAEDVRKVAAAQFVGCHPEVVDERPVGDHIALVAIPETDHRRNVVDQPPQQACVRRPPARRSADRLSRCATYPIIPLNTLHRDGINLRRGLSSPPTRRDSPRKRSARSPGGGSFRSTRYSVA